MPQRERRIFSLKYDAFKIILCSWMLNQMSVVFVPSAISHSGFYIHAAVYLLAVVFVGIPLVYSEVCIAQYTNGNAVTMFNYCPIFRGIGYGTYFLVILNAMYTLVLASWYLEYSFYSLIDPPPWCTCEHFDPKECMVKRINITTFQHCVEMQTLYKLNCMKKTASALFYEEEIGDENTLKTFCLRHWKPVAASASICMFLYILTLKKYNLFVAFAKIVFVYVLLALFLLFCAILSTKGTWYTAKIKVSLSYLNFKELAIFASRGYLTMGTGSGVIVALARFVPFRSPATMTSISMPLISVVVCLIYSLVSFSALKSMSYFHAEDQFVMDIGNSVFFDIFGSTSEILSYLYPNRLWSFLWFSSILCSLLVNQWIMFLYLLDAVLHFHFCQRHLKTVTFFLYLTLNYFSTYFFCSDLTVALTDSIRVIQTVNCLLFSISLYWIYGINNHCIDILFMIGIKTSWFWKTCWFINPFIIITYLYAIIKYDLMYDDYTVSKEIPSIGFAFNELIFYLFIGIYLIVTITGIILEVCSFIRNRDNIIRPSKFWGPRDQILFKSRKMFVPEIMTREFLYKQARVVNQTYKDNVSASEPTTEENISVETLSVKQDWTACTSN